MTRLPDLTLGAVPVDGGRCRFRVWAPHPRRLELVLHEEGGPALELERDGRGYAETIVDGVGPGTRYGFRLDGAVRPDPASRHQPDGVHGFSCVVAPPGPDPGWTGLPLEALVIYELHAGTFSTDGTFDGLEPRLDALAALGVTAIEVMPIAPFPGSRNWGYDGVLPCAVHASYGGPDGLARLVRACHRRGLAVLLDVVYNHLGPEGNYLGQFGPYFTDRYRTPWGDALNFDGPGSDEVRRLFVESAVSWVRCFGVDGLRLDAIHAIHDRTALPFLEELAARVRAEGEALGRTVHVIGESNANDVRLVRAREAGGTGLDAVWNDDLHHALHVLLTGETSGYYRDFGTVDDLGRALADGFVYDGRYSGYRRRTHGRPAPDLEPRRLVVFAHNHDQIGNRLDGARLAALVPAAAARLAAATVLLGPWLPLLFMGEEWGDPAPFLYFVSHGDPDLVAAVREGRRREFEAFDWPEEPPDPQAESTFERSRPDPALAARGEHARRLAFYRELLRLRRDAAGRDPGLPETRAYRAFEDERILWFRRRRGAWDSLQLLRLDGRPRRGPVELPEGTWHVVLDAADERWGGPGATTATRIDADGAAELALPPWAFLLLERRT